MREEDGHRRRPGRPPLDRDDPSVAVTFRLPSRRVNSLCQRAARERISVPELIRRGLSSKEKIL
jgi:hypothetical protein